MAVLTMSVLVMAKRLRLNADSPDALICGMLVTSGISTSVRWSPVTKLCPTIGGSSMVRFQNTKKASSEES
jgi:hypothetical protein